MKFKSALLIGIGLLALFAFACTNSPQSAGSTAAGMASKNCEKTLAQIGDSKICLEDFQARLEKIPPFYRKRVASKKGKLEFLNRMVEDELFFQEAVRRGLQNDPEVQDQLAQIEKSILSGKIKKELLEGDTEVTDEQAKAYYDKNKEEFMDPETVTVRHILFRVKHKASPEEEKAKDDKAKEVLGMIKSGKMSFEEAAKKYSEDKTSAKRGGELSPIRKGIKSKEFEEVAFSMNKDGEVSDVFKDRRGYNIVQFIKKTPAQEKEFDKVESRIKRKLSQDSKKETMENFTENLRNKSAVEIHEDLLVDEAEPAPSAPAGLPQLNQ